MLPCFEVLQHLTDLRTLIAHESAQVVKDRSAPQTSPSRKERMSNSPKFIMAELNGTQPNHEVTVWMSKSEDPQVEEVNN
jgi:hypothetical protein